MKTEKVKIRKTWNGVRIYPVTYMGKQYVVDIIQRSGMQKYGCTGYKIFKYNEKWRLFKGHRKNGVCSDVIPNEIKMPEYVIELDSLSITGFRRYLPYIVTAIFKFYENKKKEEETSRKELENSKNWDGVIAPMGNDYAEKMEAQ